MSSGQPQGLLIWLLNRCAPEYGHDSFVGDLLEQYELRGGWWCWRQALGAIRARAIRGLLTGAESDVPIAEYIGDLVISSSLAIFALIALRTYAELMIGWITTTRSELSTIVVSILIGVGLTASVAIVHELRAGAPTAR
ncbi:MAG TPA: hypothetical protein VMF64_07690 [Steroidobacteraceae bacterium]|nr:hypothetical protein [Steroidobacteraceae bacterium]